MNAKELLSKVDHTLLKPTATWEEIDNVASEAEQYNTATVVVPSCFVRDISHSYHDMVRICTVVGFPLGNTNTTGKIAEAGQALADGASEIDMVINIGALKAGDINYVTEEIRQLKYLCGERILKVIVETCYLTEEEKIAACQCVKEAHADFIKTSTGFGTGGATLEDIELFKKHIGSKVKIKAAGGIRTREDMEKFIAAGCERLGMSTAVKILRDEL